MAFAPAIVIHLGFIAALGVLFGITEGDHLDVLPVILMTEPASKVATPPPDVPRAAAMPVLEAPRTKSK